MSTYRHAREAQVSLSRQLPLDVAARLGVSLELGLESLDLLLGQARSRQVFGVFVVVHDGLVVVIDHLHRWMGVHVAVNGVHHGRGHHGRVIANCVVHGQTRMSRIIPRGVNITHGDGEGK